MRKLTKPFLLLFFLTLCFYANGQTLGQDHIPGQVIIQLQPDQINKRANFQLSPAKAREFTVERALYPEMGIYLLSFDPDQKDLQTALSELSKERDILYVQKNQKVEPRDTEPNDPLYLDQWYHFTLDSEKAWDVTTGGTDVQGREIVIAILDSGFDMEHEEFVDNVWINEDEIPNDGIDNDNNNYIDDYYGWNFTKRSDEHSGNGQPSTHGSNVAGMAGARGDNDQGIAGVAWDVKLLFLSGLESAAEIIEACRYTSETRKKYNQSGGSEGAYIVSSNISLGISNAMATDFPIWCNLYDVMGQNGVLNVCAVDNLDSDVDIFGDMPTTCDSEYLITVTNTDINNLKDSEAAFGLVSVDIGAPGNSNLTTSPNNNYNTISGTSVAAPLVAGAVALLYSAPCESIADQSLIDPASIALTMRNMIFSGAQPSLDLQGITSQGAVLNVYESIKSLEANCESNDGTDNTIKVFPNFIPSNQATISIDYLASSDDDEIYIHIYDTKGALVIEENVDRTFFGTNRLNLQLQNRLGQGLYFVSLVLPGNTTITEKLFVY